MNVLQQACIESNEKWLLSFEDNIITDYQYTRRHNKTMSKTNDKMRSDKYHRFTRKTAVAILVAAIILSITITVAAIPSTRDFIVEKFSNHSEYRVANATAQKLDSEIQIDYIPTGFTLTEKHANDYFCEYDYNDNSGNWFSVIKAPLNSSVSFDTEFYESEEYEYNSITYVIHKSSEEYYGVLWNNGQYVYSIDGRISKEEIIKMAKCTK